MLFRNLHTSLPKLIHLQYVHFPPLTDLVPCRLRQNVRLPVEYSALRHLQARSRDAANQTTELHQGRLTVIQYSH